MKIANANKQVYKTSLYVLLTYLFMHLSSVLLLGPFYKLLQNTTDLTKEQAMALAQGWYIALSMGIAVIITIILTSKNKHFWIVYEKPRTSIEKIIFWGIIGFFLVLFGQSIGVMIESAIGIKPGSENTKSVAGIAKGAPVAIFAIVLFGPILEEIIFRRVIFGSLVRTTNFWIAAIVSALFFAVIHFDFSHIIIYAISGFCFAFIYQQTRSIIAPILSHILLNGFVTVVQLYQQPIMDFMQQMQK